jgi:hypothetical protein
MPASLLPPQHLGPSRARCRRAPRGVERAAARVPTSAPGWVSEPVPRTRRELRSPMHDALLHHLQLGPVRDRDWVTAHFGHR